MKKVALFASGNGSNAENICNYFKESNRVDVVLLATNNRSAFVVKRLKKFGLPIFCFSKKEMSGSNVVQKKLSEHSIDLIVLCGFLLKIPKNIVDLFPKRIINIHPSLLPKFGGKGMYGERVHKAVIGSNEKFSGITVHYVNNNYDEGDIIFQKKLSLSKNETPQSLSKKIHLLEMSSFPSVIKRVVDSL
tara:strand:- start:591 stop:1160 length:570 start_codon:yes stop_codon:yes gene_type:complete